MVRVWNNSTGLAQPTADPDTEASSCCGAKVTYDEHGTLYCKGCYYSCSWSTDEHAGDSQRSE